MYLRSPFLFASALTLLVGFCSPALAASSSLTSALVLTKDNFASAISEKPTLVKFHVDWCIHCKNLKPIYEKLALKYKDDKRINVAEVDVEAQRELGTQQGIEGFPTIMWYKKGGPSDGIKYRSGKTFEELDNFVASSLAEISSEQPTPNREPRSVPVIHNEPLVVLGDSNFTKYVMDAAKNVFVKFHAPWCGHCKSMAKDYELLAEAFQHDDHIVIAHIDATVHTKFPVQGYPTLKFFPAGSDIKTPVDYSGGRKLNDMVAYINKNAGAYRATDGSLIADAGVIPELRPFLKEFFAASDKMEYLQQSMTSDVILNAQKQASFKHYRKTGELILERGLDFVQKEIARLEKILLNPKSVNPKSLDTMRLRLNIIKEFKTAQGNSQAGAEL